MLRKKTLEAGHFISIKFGLSFTAYILQNIKTNDENSNLLSRIMSILILNIIIKFNA